MCRTKEEIQQWMSELPEVPEGLITMLEPGDFHGTVNWKVDRGRMTSFRHINHENCELYETVFAENTKVNWHTHGAESDEVIVVLDGSLILVFADGNTQELHERDQVVIKKQVPHMAVIDRPTKIVAYTIPKETNE